MPVSLYVFPGYEFQVSDIPLRTGEPHASGSGVVHDVAELAVLDARSPRPAVPACEAVVAVNGARRAGFDGGHIDEAGDVAFRLQVQYDFRLALALPAGGAVAVDDGGCPLRAVGYAEFLDRDVAPGVLRGECACGRGMESSHFFYVRGSPGFQYREPEPFGCDFGKPKQPFMADCRAFSDFRPLAVDERLYSKSFDPLASGNVLLHHPHVDREGVRRPVFSRRSRFGVPGAVWAGDVVPGERRLEIAGEFPQAGGVVLVDSSPAVGGHV